MRNLLQSMFDPRGVRAPQLREVTMRTRSSRGALAALCAGLVLLAAGCIEDDRSFFIRQNQVPQTGCTVNTSTTLFRGRGMLDVSMRAGYWLYPLMENHLKSTRTTDGEPERNELQLRGFEVELDMSDILGNHPEHLTSFYMHFTGRLPPASLLAGSVKIIPDELVQQLNIPTNQRPVIVATVVAVAQRSGTIVRSAEFLYPVDLCNGCMVDLRQTCPTSTDTTIKTNTCGTPQDSPVTCCLSPKPTCYSAKSGT